jgi:hypothetical protein
MPPAGFEPTISAVERPQTYALDRTSTGTGVIVFADGYYYAVSGLQKYGAVYIGMRCLHFEGAYKHIFQVIRRRFYGTLLCTLLLSEV